MMLLSRGGRRHKRWHRLDELVSSERSEDARSMADEGPDVVPRGAKHSSLFCLDLSRRKRCFYEPRLGERGGDHRSLSTPDDELCANARGLAQR